MCILDNCKISHCTPLQKGVFIAIIMLFTTLYLCAFKEDNSSFSEISLDHWKLHLDIMERTAHYPEILYFRLNAMIDFGVSPFEEELALQVGINI